VGIGIGVGIAAVGVSLFFLGAGPVGLLGALEIGGAPDIGLGTIGLGTLGAVAGSIVARLSDIFWGQKMRWWMQTVLQIIGAVVVVAASFWIMGTGTIWLLDKGRLSDAPLFDGGKLASPARVKEAYEQRANKQHQFYLRLRRGLPWSMLALALGIALVVIGSH
jgi:hypothetical protein